MSTTKKIGILGGTFDPPHIGHLKMASHFAKLLHLDELLLIPSGEPWQKGSDITPAEIRFQLTQAAAIDLTRALRYQQIPTQVGIDRIEMDRAGPSYAIDTVKALRERYGDQASLIWLMGADSFIQLPTWNAWKDLIRYVNFAVASRPQYDLQTELSPAVVHLLQSHQTRQVSALESQASGLIYIDDSLAIDLSSTKLRLQLKQSKSRPLNTDQIPSSTLQIIANLGLYQ